MESTVTVLEITGFVLILKLMRVTWELQAQVQGAGPTLKVQARKVQVTAMCMSAR